MATLAYLEPAYYPSGQQSEPDSQPFPVTGGTSLKRGDFVTIASGLLTKPAANIATGFVGLAEHDSSAVFFTGLGGATGIATPQAANTALFGATTATTAMQPGQEINGVKCILAHGIQQFEISLAAGTAWALSLLGTTAGLNYDAASGFYFADPALANKILTIVGPLDGPNKGTIGDFGKRVLVTFSAASLAL